MKRNVVVAAGLMVALSASVGCAGGRTSWTHGTAVVAAATTQAAGTPVAVASAPHAAETAMASMSSPSSTAPVSDQAAADVIEIHTFDLGYKPAEVTVPAAGTYTVRLVNDGAIAHDVTFADGSKIAAEAGQTAEGSVQILPAARRSAAPSPGTRLPA